MRGLIILDGPDAAGKTTLAGEIKSRVTELGGKAVIEHLGKPDEGTAWKMHSDALVRYIDTAFNHDTVVIADRHFLSEAIYGMVYRKGSEYPITARHVDRLLYRFRALRVICSPNSEYVVEMHRKMKAERHEEYDDGMDRINNCYLNLWKGTFSKSSLPGKDYVMQLEAQGGVKDKLGWYRYDVTQQGKDMRLYASFLLQELKDEIDMLPEDLYDIERYRFTGFPHPNAVLLVGDRINEGKDNIIHAPFFANEGSSLYLAQALHKNCVLEEDIVIANINDPHGVDTVRMLSQMCGYTIALGREAERALHQNGIRFNLKVRHPQHARRFNHHDESYTEELKIALKGRAGVL